jgi:hypothetical protein
VIAGVILEIGIQEFVPGTDHQRRPQLKRATPGLLLTVPGRRTPDSRSNRGRLGKRHESESLGADYFCRRSVLVEKYVEGHPLIFDKRLGVTFPAGSDGDDIRTCGKNVFVSVADLTGPLATRQSAKVPEKQNDGGLFGPSVTETVFAAVGIDQNVFA